MPFDGGEIVVKVRLDKSEIDSGLGQITSSLKRLTAQGILVGAGIMAAQSAINALKSAIGGLTNVIKSGVADGLKNIEQFNTSVISTASILTSLGKTPSMESFQQNLKYSQNAMQQLDLVAAKFISSGQEIQTIFSAMATNGIVPVTKKDFDALGQISDAVKVITAGQNFEVQGRQEINALMQGQVVKGARLSEIVAKTTPDFKEWVEQHKKMGDLIPALSAKLKGFAFAQGEVTNLSDTWKSTLQTIWGMISRQAFAGVYRDIVSSLQKMSGLFLDHNNQMTSFARMLTQRIQLAWEKIRTTVNVDIFGWLEKNGPQIIDNLATALQVTLKIAQLIGESIRLTWNFVVGPFFDSLIKTAKFIYEFSTFLKTGKTDKGSILLAESQAAQRYAANMKKATAAQAEFIKYYSHTNKLRTEIAKLSDPGKIGPSNLPAQYRRHYELTLESGKYGNDKELALEDTVQKMRDDYAEAINLQKTYEEKSIAAQRKYNEYRRAEDKKFSIQFGGSLWGKSNKERKAALAANGLPAPLVSAGGEDNSKAAKKAAKELADIETDRVKDSLSWIKKYLVEENKSQEEIKGAYDRVNKHIKELLAGKIIDAKTATALLRDSQDAYHEYTLKQLEERKKREKELYSDIVGFQKDANQEIIRLRDGDFEARRAQINQQEAEVLAKITEAEKLAGVGGFDHIAKIESAKQAITEKYALQRQQVDKDEATSQYQLSLSTMELEIKLGQKGLEDKKALLQERLSQLTLATDQEKTEYVALQEQIASTDQEIANKRVAVFDERLKLVKDNSQKTKAILQEEQKFLAEIIFQNGPDSAIGQWAVSKTNDIKEQLTSSTDFMRQSWKTAVDDLYRTWEGGFTDAFTGNLKNLGDYFKSWGQTIQKMMAQIFANFVWTNTVGKWLQNIPGIGTGGEVAKKAGGGVFQGFQPIVAAAGGYVFNRPTLGLVGEGDYAEAVIPMPNGMVEARVTGFGGGQPQQQNLHIHNVLDPSFIAAIRTGPDEIINTISADIFSNGKTTQTIRRAIMP